MKASLAGIAAAAGVSKSALATDSSVKVISNSLFGLTPKKTSRQDKDAAVIRGLLDKDNLPTTGQEWISLPDDGSGRSRIEYQPNDFADESDPDTARHLRAVRDRFLLDGAGRDRYSKQFIDGGETYYDEYAQAWRLLGFYIDCDSPYQYQSDCWGSDDKDGEGGGEDRENGQEVQYDEDGNIVRNCVRYLLWAAVSFLMQYGILFIYILACIVTRDTVL